VHDVGFRLLLTGKEGYFTGAFEIAGVRVIAIFYWVLVGFRPVQAEL